MKKNNFKYKIKNIKIFGNHGLYKEEIELGQNFYISLCFSSFYLDIDQDNIKNNIDYVDVIKKVNDIFNSKRYNLLETLSYDMHKELIKDFNFNHLQVSIKKKNPKIENSVKYISVTYPNE
tara:strand:- start:10 stop:372 length:363 start_codon:yes stop_codon:yes gene_type:complete